MGTSNSRSAQKLQLTAAEQRIAALETEAESLKAQVQEQAAELTQHRGVVDATERMHLRQLKEKQLAGKQERDLRNLVEVLRDNEALLAKRLMHAQLRPLSGGHDSALLGSNLQDCEIITAHNVHEIEKARLNERALESVAMAHHRAELSRELWLSELCDISLTLRSTRGLLLVGLRTPCARAAGLRGCGLCPCLAVLRHVGGPTVQGPWAAAGGSLLWDARKCEVTAMRLALCAQPTINQQLAISFDHTGGLSARCGS